MTEEQKTKKIRRDDAALKAHLAAKIKEIELRGEKKDKAELAKLAAAAQLIAQRRTSQPTIGQAATLLAQASVAIKVE